ncbi:hypothetical protein EV356DRAFT_4141 [Viridothelium virens]|uniref:UBA domain-containing protein n=1 Tax=Viridothelium virens TaxID=1048519 RepID=A0A6A6HQ44_VIRVR|nr:hypothetical protein EV356DRAFT_4141 [Viridothelium virens]
MKQFIIQDSDEEDDLAATRPAEDIGGANEDNVTPKGESAITHMGSVDVARRAIQDVHRALFEQTPSQPPAHHADQDAEPYELCSQQRPKRRRTAEETPSPQIKIPRCKSEKTYNSPRESHVAQLSSPVKWNEKSRLYTVSFSERPDIEAAMATSPVIKSQEQAPLNGIPDASSTVIAGSSTQQKLVEDALASNHIVTAPNEKPDGLEQHTASSSILWSTSPSSLASKEPRADESASRTTRDPGVSLLDQVRPDKRRKRRKISGENCCEHMGQSGSWNDVSPASPGVDDSQVLQSGEEVDREQAPGKPPSRNATDLSQANLSSDEVAIGLPKEQYKPRPSRSRSARVEEGPIDLSVRPERVSRNRRRKTTDADAEFAKNHNDSASKLASIVSTGFSPSRAKEALRELQGDVERAVDRLCRRPPSSTQDSLNGEISLDRPDENRSNAPQHYPAANHEIRLDLNIGPATGKVATSLSHVEITPGTDRRSPRSSVSSKQGSRKAKRRKPTHFDESRIPSEMQDSEDNSTGENQKISDPGTNTHSAADDAQQATKGSRRSDPPPTKRGRGRPRKVRDQSSRGDKSEQQDGNEVATSANEPLKEVQVNARTLMKESSPAKEESQKITPDRPATEESPVELTLPTVAITTTAEKAEPDRSPAQRSPAGKGKVTYRVGLSRRARIAPLLKMVKK